MIKDGLIWTPTWDYLAEKISVEGQLALLIAPFVKQSPLGRIVDLVGDVSNLKIVAKWSGADILSGVSDLEVYPYLREKGIPLYIHPRIHLKLLVFDRNIAFHTSGNVTDHGLGLIENANVEIGCQVRLALEDWIHIYGILETSHRVDDTMYQEALTYLEKNRNKIKNAPPLELKPTFDKKFSILSLPASESPKRLYEFYCALSSDTDEVERYMHDLVLFHVPLGFGQEEFFSHVGTVFRGQPFVQRIVELIKIEKSARFGLVTEWIQNNCSDKPTPYRWEIKNNTACLYNWLEYFYDQISWKVPGQHSQVIYWQDI